MRLQQRTRRATKTRQKMGAKLIAAGAVLQMSADELRGHIEQELSTNPALELSMEAICPACRSVLLGGTCRNCGLGRTQDSARQAAGDGPLPSLSPPPSPDESYDPFARAETPYDLQEHLRLQARLALDKALQPIGDYLIANIDDRGLLECDVAEVAATVGASPERVEEVIGVIQTFEPAGVGSRTPRESLLTQLAQLTEDGKGDSLAYEMVRDHWHELANHAYSRIARALRRPVEEIEQSAEFIRTRLDPYPGRQFRAFWDSKPRNPEAIQRADVVIRRDTDTYTVEIADRVDSALRISDAYRHLHRRLLRENRGWGTTQSQNAIDLLKRAEWFIQSIRMRYRTLRQVTESIVEVQRPFLDTGLEEKLRPLTRARLAQTLGKHESTISRAISNKYVLLPDPSSRIVGYDIFLTPSLSVKSIIADLIRRESPNRPLTDQQICQVLAQRGCRIARRTVAKYRLALQIPSSEQRGRK